jgi:hypothetical protein
MPSVSCFARWALVGFSFGVENAERVEGTTSAKQVFAVAKEGSKLREQEEVIRQRRG